VDDGVTITAHEDGPLLVRGPVTFRSQDGQVVDPGRTTAGRGAGLPPAQLGEPHHGRRPGQQQPRPAQPGTRWDVARAAQVTFALALPTRPCEWVAGGVANDRGSRTGGGSGLSSEGGRRVCA
jgi:hypothetical protein